MSITFCGDELHLRKLVGLAWWAALLVTAVMCGPIRAAPPDFSTSNAIHEPVPAVAGDVLHYAVTVTNTGGDSAYARIKTVLPQGSRCWCWPTACRRSSWPFAKASIDRTRRPFH
ncbi:MAG: DUF11 domain-containing protein [Mesorhizobium sp.]|nr:DUF11 domain-containing protein [Mesorhizobium sp. M4A.F.Ca.ET.029.04.2.1]TIW34539.1 MAG: DUF11 domain-containing protein [Mesorhizobium sp.]